MQQATLSMTDAARETRVRRDLARRGLALVKSRCRTPEAIVYGTYGVIDAQRNAYVWYAFDGFGLDLDDIEAWLRDDQQTDDARPEVSAA